MRTIGGEIQLEGVEFRPMMRRLVGLLLLVAIVGGGAFAYMRMRPAGVARQSDALEQYFYARSLWLEPGFRARGTERQRLLREAIAGLQAVVVNFPEPAATVTRALAEYDTGLCYRAMGETDRARQAFLRVRDYKRFANDTGAARMHAAGRDTIQVLVDAAQQQIRQLEGRS